MQVIIKSNLNITRIQIHPSILKQGNHSKVSQVPSSLASIQ